MPAPPVSGPLTGPIPGTTMLMCPLQDLQVPSRSCSHAQPFKDMREQLYNNFAEGQDKVEGIEGLAVAARHTGRGQKRKKVATQNQAIVRWAPTVMQGWVVELAKQKGYHIDDAPEHALQPMTHHEVCNTPNLPAECCCPNAHLPARRIPARTTLAHCSICSRRYHIDCLPLTHRPAGDILEEDVTTGWTCIECNRDQYATKGLPLDMAISCFTGNRM